MQIQYYRPGHCSRDLKEHAYTVLVRPRLEYCSCVWDLHTNSNINQIEAIQRRAARYVFNKYHPMESVSSMIKELNWQSLETRRRNASLTIMYRISHNQLPSINPLNFLTLVPPGISTCSYHPLKYNLFSPCTNIYKNSFFPKNYPCMEQSSSACCQCLALPVQIHSESTLVASSVKHLRNLGVISHHGTLSSSKVEVEIEVEDLSSKQLMSSPGG